MSEELVLINDREMKQLKNLGYTELLDWQFNLLQQTVDIANEIIHKEYKDDHILQQGLYMLKRMVLLNMVNRTVVERYPDSEVGEFLFGQYTQTTKQDISRLITGEIEQLKQHFDEIEEILTVDFDNEKRRVDGMNTVKRIATLNLREYEDALNRVFREPTHV